MSAEAAVKKRSKSKKVVLENERVGIAKDLSVETPVKKIRTRKTIPKTTEVAESETPAVEAPTVKKNRETKKNASPKTTNVSKRTAKTSANDVPLESPSTETSKILKEATAFVDQKEMNKKEMVGKSQPQSNIEGAVSEPAKHGITFSNPIPSPNATSELPIKPSSFLNSFFNDPEPAPVPVPEQQQKQPEPSPLTKPEDSRPATTHEFEDSILTSQGKVKTPQQPNAASTPILEPPPPATAMSSAQLRAFTTSSFAALKNSSEPASKSNSSMPAASTMSTSNTPVTTPFKSMKASSEATTAPPPPPSPRIRLRLPPKTVPSTSTNPPPPRPTQLPYSELQKDPQYRTLKRKWARVMVAIPFAVWSSYELWKRWDRGDLMGGERGGWIARERPKKVDENGEGVEGLEGPLEGKRGGEGERVGRETESGWQQDRSVAHVGEAGAGATIVTTEQQPAELSHGVHIEFPVPGAGNRAEQYASGSRKGWVQVFK